MRHRICLCLIATLLDDLANTQFVFLVYLPTFPTHTPCPLWNHYTIIPLQIRSSRRRKQSWGLQSSRRDCQSVVCERRGPWDVGPRTQDETWEEKRTKKVLEGEPDTKDISSEDTDKQVVHQSSWKSGLRIPDLTSGPCRSALSLHSVSGWETESHKWWSVSVFYLFWACVCLSWECSCDWCILKP